MATVGPVFPTAASAVNAAPESIAWAGAVTNVFSDNGVEATVTAATFDADAISQQLRAVTFDFSSIPDGSTIDGITVAIERRFIVGGAVDNRVQLQTAGGSFVGDNKASATAWPSTVGIATYGGAADTWNAGLTAAQVKTSTFGVVLSVKATAANTDIGVDFIRMTIDYTAPSVPSQGSASGSIAWVGSATGVRASNGAATGSITWAGSATGTSVHSGAASGAVAWVGEATGEQPIVPPNEGTATGAVDWAGSATGTSVHSGSATGSISWAGAADGARSSSGAASGSIIWIGDATGAAMHAGAGSGSVAWSGAATGATAHQGAADGTVTWAGEATGEAPIAGVNDGTAAGTILWAGTATGSTTHSGTAAGAIVWTGVSAVGHGPAPVEEDEGDTTIPDEDRILPVNERRTLRVPAENRTVEVPTL